MKFQIMFQINYLILILIGYLEKGKFNKIVSKGEFEDGKYLDISLREGR